MALKCNNCGGPTTPGRWHECHTNKKYTMPNRCDCGLDDCDCCNPPDSSELFQKSTYKIYIASRGRNQQMCRDLARLLDEMGHGIVSSWIDVDLEEESDKSIWPEIAQKDLNEIDQCDILVLMTEGCEAVPGGMWYEAGYAHAKGKKVIVIGPRHNVFCTLHNQGLLRISTI